MENLSLVLAADSDLTVKSFVVRESLSAPFDIEVVAYAPADNLPFDAIIGHKASFRIATPWPDAAPRAWTGIVSRIEQIDAEPSGVTTYSIRLSPALWRLSRRSNCRVFQHLSIPEIASALLAEWEIQPLLRLDPTAFARHEYRVQYGESDFAFLSRLLEEAGIAYLFEDPETPKNEADQPWSTLVLAEDASRREPRATSPEYWNTPDLPNDREAVSRVRAMREVRPGRATIRDFDFRSRPKHKLLASAAAASESENRIEAFEYSPGAFVVEPSPDGARVDEREAQARADKALAAARGGRFTVSYRSNVPDLAPGVVFTMGGHPHPDLGEKRLLLVTGQRIEGNRAGEWLVTGEATFGDEAHRPARLTAKPKIAGVQSAFVVGPAGEEIHTDGLGRVRVEFHWDREGKSDEKSSCFVRVSQGWAGPGYGIVSVPRVGEEVVVGFFDGDPDQPVVVGRVHNAAAPPPQALPANKTKTLWRSNSSPGGGGYNEIALEDKKGEELVALRAERDYERIVLREERAAIGTSLTTKIGASEVRQIEADQKLTIGGSRTVAITGTDALTVGEALSIDLGGNAGGTFSKDKKIVFTTGEASIVLDGPNLYLDARAILSLRSGEALSLSGGDVKIDGQPNINLNSAQAAAPFVALLDGSMLNIDLALPPGAPPLDILADLIASPLFDPGKAPGELSIPPEIEAQLAAARHKIFAGLEEIVTKIENIPDLIGQDVLPEVEAARAAAYARIEAARKWLETAKAQVAAEIARWKAEVDKWKAEIVALKGRIEQAADHLRERIQGAIKTVQDKIQSIRDQARETLQGIKDKIQTFREDVKTRFDALRAQAIEFRNKVVGPFEEIRNGVKQVSQQVKDTVAEFKENIKGVIDDVKGAVKDVKEQVQAIKKDAQDLFGLKSAFKDIKNDITNEVKGTANEVKQAWNETKQGAKEAVGEVKQAWNEAKQGAKEAVGEAKQAWNDTKQGAKEAVGEAKQAWNDTKQGAKDAVDEIKGLFDGSAFDEDPMAAADALDGGDGADAGSAMFKKAAQGAPGAGGGLDAPQGALGKAAGFNLPNAGAGGNGSNAVSGFQLPGNAVQASSARGAMSAGASAASGSSAMSAASGSFGGSAASLGGSAGSSASQALAGSFNGAVNGGGASLSQNVLAGSTVVTRAGGFTPEGMVSAVNAGHAGNAPTLLQSPGEGQLLVLRTQNAAALSSEEFTASFVDGQMDGLTSGDAFTAALQSKGYLVYERPFDGWLTTMLKKAVL